MPAIEDSPNVVVLPIHRAIQHALKSVEMRMLGQEPATPYLMGSPGGGKTQMSRQFARDRGWNCIAYSPALERVEKFGGIPEIIHQEDTGELHTLWSVPQLICEVRALATNGKPTVVLLDDWHLCPEDIQQIGFELFTYHSLNGHRVPQNVQFILAGNETSAAGARVQLSAIRNRCITFRVFSDPHYWVDNFAIPNNLHDIGISFFSANDNMPYFHEEESTSHQFGSPRSWTAALIQLASTENDKDFLMRDRDGNMAIPIIEVQAILEGCVSKQAAAKFIEYFKIYKSINTKEIFDSGKFTVPTENVKRFAFASAICSEFYNRYTSGKERKKPASEVFVSIMNELHKTSKEIAVKALRTIAKKPKIKELEMCDGQESLSGGEILTEIIKKGSLNMKLLEELRQSIGILNQGSK